MKFEPLNIEQHDLKIVTELIYETELAIFRSLLGKDKEDAIYNIKRLIKSGNNSLGHEHIYVVSEKDKRILGILVSFSGRQRSFWNDFRAYYKILNFTDFLKCMVKGTVINELLTAHIGRDDYYLSNIAVDPACRGQGVGTYILKNALLLAEKAECNRVILDVTLDNKGALRLYQRFGFKVYGKTSSKWIFKSQGTFNMEIELAIKSSPK